MKPVLLKTAIAATASLIASQAPAGMLTHDHYKARGDQQFHYVISNGSLYEANGGSNTSEEVENQTLRVHFRSATEGVTNRNLSCSEPDGDHTEGLEESWRAEEVNTWLTLAGGQTSENSQLNAFDCDIDIGPQGEVLGGWTLNTSVSFSGIGAPIHTVQLLTVPRRTIAWFGPCDAQGSPGGPPVDINTALATNALFDQLMEQNGQVAPGELDTHPNAPTKPTGCTVFGITKMSLGQCDPWEATTKACIANIAKQVPVPAFAAAALGLGLLGITWLTARRKAQ